LVGCLQVCGPPSRSGLESPTATLSATGRPLAVPRRQYSYPRPVWSHRFGSGGTETGCQRTRSYVSRVLKPDAWFSFPRGAHPVSGVGGHSNRQFRAIGCRRGRTLRADKTTYAGTAQKPSPEGVYGAYPRPEGRGFAPVQSHKLPSPQGRRRVAGNLRLPRVRSRCPALRPGDTRYGGR
jgi:hypothetical protein